MGVYGDGIQNDIGKWLEKLMGRFPYLYITPSIRSCYGYTERYNLGDHIDHYQPQPAAEISIHPGPFDRMCRLKDRMAEYKKTDTPKWLSKTHGLEDDLRRAQESRDPKAITAAEFALNQHDEICGEMKRFSRNYKVHYERSLFYLAVTIAHEGFHVLTGYWTGFVEQTPPKFCGEFPEDGRGEAGEWWEYKHGFNGFTDLVWHKQGKDKDDPYPLDDENMSAGIPFLKQTRRRDDGSAGAEWTRISHAFIKRIHRERQV
ncbi:hypothetical protein FJTKL_06582 [Diaporthe vaccinii]|uniref:Uncharacterized protein n=1 Tax=Diaporthe vaccinii TaxID=105482 RepID=A0ABR4DTB8_9PEZI